MEKFGDLNPHEHGFVIRMGDKDYVTTEGLLYLMGIMFDEYSVRAEVPTQDEIDRLRHMMTMPEDAPMVIMRGVIETDRGTFVDYGTTSPKNLSGFVKFSHYPIEMACRRATNRAMRIATGAGTSIDEMDTEISSDKQVTFKKQEDTQAEVLDVPANNGQPTPEPVVEMAEPEILQRLLDRTDALHNQGVLTKTQTDAMISRISKGMTFEKAMDAKRSLDKKRNEWLEKRKQEQQADGPEYAEDPARKA